MFSSSENEENIFNISNSDNDDIILNYHDESDNKIQYLKKI